MHADPRWELLTRLVKMIGVPSAVTVGARR